MMNLKTSVFQFISKVSEMFTGISFSILSCIWLLYLFL